MPRYRNLRRFPSHRNLLIYHELAYQGRTQQDVAADFGISQVRVSQIGRQVRAWVDGNVRPRFFVGQPGLRLHLALANERMRLHEAYDPLLELILGDDRQPRYVKRQVTVIGGEALQTVEVSELPNFRLWHEAADVQGRLAELEAVSMLGPFHDIPGEVRQTTVHRVSKVAADGSNSPVVSNASAPAPAAHEGLSNPHKNGSNAHENRGQGVLEVQPSGDEWAAQVVMPAAVAATPSGAIGGENCGTGSF